MLDIKQVLQLIGKQQAEIFDLQGQVGELQTALKSALEQVREQQEAKAGQANSMPKVLESRQRVLE